MKHLWINSDNRIRLGHDLKSIPGLSNADDNTAVNDATVTFSVLTPSGQSLGFDDIAMTYDSGSDGNYWGTFDQADALTLLEGQTYIVEVKAVQGATQMVWRHEVRAKYRDN